MVSASGGMGNLRQITQRAALQMPRRIVRLGQQDINLNINKWGIYASITCGTSQ